MADQPKILRIVATATARIPVAIEIDADDRDQAADLVAERVEGLCGHGIGFIDCDGARDVEIHRVEGVGDG